MEGMACEFLNAGNPWQLGAFERPTRHDDKTRLEDVLAISRNCPALSVFIPARLFDLGLETGLVVEVEVLANPLGMRKDLRLEGILFLRDVAGFFEQWQIHVGFDVTLRSRIAIPVPGPTKISRLLNDAKVSDSDLLQPRCS